MAFDFDSNQEKSDVFKMQRIQDDFESPTKLKKLESINHDRHSNQSEDDSPNKHVRVSPTKKKLISCTPLQIKMTKEELEARDAALRKQSEEIDKKIKVMLQEIMETRKEAKKAIEQCNETKSNYIKAQADFEQKFHTKLFENIGNEHF